MKGLEIVEQRFSQLERTWRLDAEFFQPKHVTVERALATKQCLPLSVVASVSDGNHFSISESFVDDGIPYYRGQDVVGNFFIEQATPKTISKTAFMQPTMVRSHLKQGDVLLSIVGTVGETSLVKTDELATCSCKLAILRPKGIAPGYLAAYLSSALGYSLTTRWKRGAVQMGLLLEDMDQLPVPRLSLSLEQHVSSAVELAFQALATSRRSLTLAESNMLDALGMQNWKAPEPLSYVRSSSEAFAAGRLDAQHFLPKYKLLTDHIDATGDGRRLGNCLRTIQRGKQPDYAEHGLQVINSKHVLRGEVRLDDDNRLAAHTEDDCLIQPGDVLMNGTGVGTIGRCAPYLHSVKAIPDNHVTILRPNPELDAVYLSVFLNSMAGQWQVEQRLRGSSGQIELYPGDISAFTVWLAPAAVQSNIRHLVLRSFEQKQRATQLLDAAKRAVEIAIEDSEAAAMDYLESVHPINTGC